LRAIVQLYDKSVQILRRADIVPAAAISDYGDACSTAGKTTRKVVPAFSALVTSMSPPWDCAIACEMGSGRPRR